MQNYKELKMKNNLEVFFYKVQMHDRAEDWDSQYVAKTIEVTDRHRPTKLPNKVNT